MASTIAADPGSRSRPLALPMMRSIWTATTVQPLATVDQEVIVLSQPTVVAIALAFVTRRIVWN
jgi:hypothetical protein